ncbi:LysR family transcriptional regulator [Bdellovibrio sp. 22V]|uniref:LysR family transcriptional regulator n=1 Tax=Bdellovibrio sp. 22V TaxID=3044166 RepID=UPI00254297E7|nr:LysR family transcriptional regulator [Bdellovibrio sp. 22V]WII71611.1 LysR family transcriptional regulator [Bdellovibrio sp. 22V]
MNLLHLQYFYVVAKEQGFTNASKALRIQQPAISRMVKLLEDDIGFDLFEKVGRRVQLTPKGMEVFEHCQRIFGSVDDLKQSLGKISGEVKGPLKLAASEPIASHFLPEVLEKYLAKHPQVYPNIFSGPASMLLEKIENGQLELGLFFHIPDLSEKLEIFAKKEIQYHLVIRKDLRRKKDVLESFIGSREIDDSSTRKFPTLEKLRKIHPNAQIKISSNNLTAHKEMVLRGLGVSVLPEFLVAEELKEGLLSDLLPKEDLLFHLKFIKRKTAQLSTAAQTLMYECTN